MLRVTPSVPLPTVNHLEGTSIVMLSSREIPDTRNGFLGISEPLFAGLSVLIGCLALMVALLQLRYYCRARPLNDRYEIFELEAGSSEVEKSTCGSELC